VKNGISYQFFDLTLFFKFSSKNKLSIPLKILLRGKERSRDFQNVSNAKINPRKALQNLFPPSEFTFYFLVFQEKVLPYEATFNFKKISHIERVILLTENLLFKILLPEKIQNFIFRKNDFQFLIPKKKILNNIF